MDQLHHDYFQFTLRRGFTILSTIPNHGLFFPLFPAVMIFHLQRVMGIFLTLSTVSSEREYAGVF